MSKSKTISRTFVSTTITSAPGLAAAIRETDHRSFSQSISQGMPPCELVPMYQIEGNAVAEEAETAARVVGEITERLRRLGAAYGEWSDFDAPAYFDLSHEQNQRLVHVSERVSTVYIAFFADLLLPSFHAAETFWVEHFVPAYHAAWPAHDATTIARNGADSAFDATFQDEVQPEMTARWSRLLAVIRQAREILASDIGFLTTNGSHEERARWRRAWHKAPASGLDSTLVPSLSTIPTLALSFEFPLPAFRQSGRLRRLRRNRDHLRFRRAGGFA